MQKRKKAMIKLLRGGISQNDIVKSLHMSKRDVSACAKVIEERGLTIEQVEAMTEKEIADAYFPKKERGADGSRLQPELEGYIERKKHNRKLPLAPSCGEYVAQADAAGKEHYAYSTFCQLFSEEAERRDAKRHFRHAPGAKAYVDWAGDVAHLTDRITGARSAVYLFVLDLPFSGKLWAGGFPDTKMASWIEGHVQAFEYIGGVPGLIVPDNAATATKRPAPKGVTLLTKEYERLAEHYGTGILPARVRKPRDKSTAESAVDLVETWIIAPSEEMVFYTMDEFNEWVAERVDWLNSRPFSAKDGSRDSVFEEEERDRLLPLPEERFERCEWFTPKVSPDYHVLISYMRYSVPHELIGEQVSAKATSTKVTIMHGGEVVAVHPRLHGRRGQYHTCEEHMPKSHAALDDPWSRDRFERWARNIGPETELAVTRLMDGRKVVQQSFVACRNILGLAKTYTPELLERACADLNRVGAEPNYGGAKARILALRAKDSEAAELGKAVAPDEGDEVVEYGLTRGADAYRIEGGE